MYTHREQIAHGEKLVAAAASWAESRGLGLEKTRYAKTFAAACAAVQDAGPNMLSFEEMGDLLELLAEVGGVLDEASKMAGEFYDIPIAVTVLDGRVFGAYIGNMEPYDLKYKAVVALRAIETGMFNDQQPGEIDGKPVTWWRNKR